MISLPRSRSAPLSPRDGLDFPALAVPGSPVQRALYRLDLNGLPVVGVVDQHRCANRQSSWAGSNRDRTTVKKFADIALRSDIRLRVDRLSFCESLTASANLCKP